MKIILDANIFISSFFWGGNPRSILERVITKADELFLTKEILDEIEDVLARPKFHTGKTEIEYFIKSIEEIGNKIAAKERVQRSRDKKDNKYIECAMASYANYIISGDIHLLEIKKHGSIKIVSAKEYLGIIQ